MYSVPRLTLATRAAFGRIVDREQLAERSKFGYPLDTDLAHADQAKIDRVAIGCALVEHGYFTFTRRPNTPPIKNQFAVKSS